MKIKIAGIVAVMSLFSGAGYAAVMDFESAPTGGCDVNAGGSLDGFTFDSYSGSGDQYSSGFNNSTACSFLSPTAKSGANFATNYNSILGGFERDSGVFSIESLWVRADERIGTSTVEFFGYASSLGSATLYSTTAVITTTWTQVTFTGWDNLGSFAWGSLIPDTSNISIDDVTYTASSVAPVPIPASLPLLAFGVGGLGLMVRRKRKAA